MQFMMCSMDSRVKSLRPMIYFKCLGMMLPNYTFFRVV